MIKEKSLKELEKEIERKRERLNFLVLESLNRNEILVFSAHLDKLIDRYYRLQLAKDEQ